MYKSPFLRLDEMRKDREANTYQTMVESAREFGKIPLTAQAMLKENEQRQANAAKVQAEAAADKQAGAQEDAKLAELVRHNKATEGIGGINAQSGVTRAGATASRVESQNKTARTKEGDTLLENIGIGAYASNRKLTHGELTDQILQDPTSIESGTTEREASAAAQRAMDAVVKKEHDMKNEDDRVRAALISASKPPAPRQERLVGVGYADAVGKEKAFQSKLRDILAEIKDMPADRFGIIQDLTEQYGPIIGIQDDQQRMSYTSMFNEKLKLRSGATVTPDELRRLQQEIPSWRAGKGVIAEALARSIRDIDVQIAARDEAQIRYGRGIPGGAAPKPVSPSNPAKTPPPKNPGESRSDYAMRLMKETGMTMGQVMKFMQGGG